MLRDKPGAAGKPDAAGQAWCYALKLTMFESGSFCCGIFFLLEVLYNKLAKIKQKEEGPKSIC